MTQAQQDAVKRAGDIILEHFDSGVLIVEASMDDGDERELWWHGGLSSAVGLTTIAKIRLMGNINIIPKEEEE